MSKSKKEYTTIEEVEKEGGVIVAMPVKSTNESYHISLLTWNLKQMAIG